MLNFHPVTWLQDKIGPYTAFEPYAASRWVMDKAIELKKEEGKTQSDLANAAETAGAATPEKREKLFDDFTSETVAVVAAGAIAYMTTPVGVFYNGVGIVKRVVLIVFSLNNVQKEAKLICEIAACVLNIGIDVAVALSPIYMKLGVLLWCATYSKVAIVNKQVKDISEKSIVVNQGTTVNGGLHQTIVNTSPDPAALMKTVREVVCEMLIVRKVRAPRSQGLGVIQEEEELPAAQGAPALPSSEASADLEAGVPGTPPHTPQRVQEVEGEGSSTPSLLSSLLDRLPSWRKYGSPGADRSLQPPDDRAMVPAAPQGQTPRRAAPRQLNGTPGQERR